MKETFDVVIVELNNQLIGILCDEIKKIFLHKELEVLFQHKNDKGYTGLEKIISMGDIFQVDANFENSCLIMVGNKKHYGIVVPQINEVRNIHFEKLLPIPKYIRQKQDPLFVWGFAHSDNDRIMIITFEFLLESEHELIKPKT